MNRIIPYGLSTALLALTAACSTHPTQPQSASSMSSSTPAAQLASCDGATALAPQATADAVLAACGQPSFRDAWGMSAEIPQANVLAPVEEWYYNPGPNGEVQVLRFVEGRVATVSRDGAGFDPRTAGGDCVGASLSKGLSKYRLAQACGQPVSRSAYVVDPKQLDPGSSTFTQGTALIEGDKQNGKVAIYREALSYEVAGGVTTVTVQNGRVFDVYENSTRVSSAE
ncbi:DUF2845 domain-containing protein [Hydrocarboniphaga sp.]|uniref:DUF2845 domain-containing protein n=1 Tax=Hydrocarboniphaga sp. TaxID=2033016 RepID=UPI003D0BE87A